MGNLIVGICGAKQSGKDTVANYILDTFGGAKVSFADPIRTLLEVTDPIVYVFEGAYDYIRYNDAVKLHGYDGAKKMYPEIRRLMQLIGTEWGRRQVHANFWVNLFKTSSSFRSEAVLVAPDVRFPNEVEAIHTWSGGGILLRVRREAAEAVEDDHESEAHWRTMNADVEIDNNGDLADTYDQVYNAVAAKFRRPADPKKKGILAW